MKNISELTDFYYKVLYPDLQHLEQQRKELKKKITQAALGLTFVLLLIVGFLLSYNMPVEIFVFVGFGYISIGGFLYRYMTKEYTFDFKQKIIEPLIHAIDEQLSYSAQAYVPRHVFEHSDLFTSRIDRFRGNDYIQGKIDGIPIEFSDLHVEKKERTQKRQEYWHTIFKGLFIASEFNKKFHGKTVVLPDRAQNTFGDMLGHWLQSNNLHRDALVKMDSPEFEKEFVVYSTDQIEARYILSHSLMQRILNFKHKSKHPLYVSFIANRIYLAIYYDKDLFEPSVFRSLLEYKIAMEYIQTLHLAVGIIEELKLNKKLWSKQ